MNLTKNLTNRNLSLDILKILSMVMVIILHTNTYGLSGITFEATDKFYWVTNTLQSLFLVAVNCFVLINGYFSSTSTFRVGKLVKLCSLATVFSIGTYATLCLIPSTEVSWSVYTILANLFPVISNNYWFFTCYIILTVLSPFINKFINMLEWQAFKKLLLILLILFVAIPSVNIFGDNFGTSRGYSVLWFIILYLVGAYIRRFPLPKLPYGIFYIAISVFSVICCSILNYLNQYVNLFEDLARTFSGYNSVTVFAGSVFLFLFFLNHPLKLNGIGSKFISSIFSSVFGVYLLHEHPVIRNILWNNIVCLQDTTGNLWSYFTRLTISVVVIFVAGVIADLLITTLITVCEKLIIKIIKKK